jgi:uncharacterized damage-inducible protein DinB
MKAAFFGLLCFTSLAAQPGTSMLSRAEFVENWKTSREFTLAVAEAMPEDLYKYKPNPEVMSFGALMVHIAQSNHFRFAQVAGDDKARLVNQKLWTKATILDALRQSFDYCIATLETVSEDKLHKMYEVGWFQRPQVTGSQLLLGMYAHTAHHRAQAETYMRANNVTPPSYRP